MPYSRTGPRWSAPPDSDVHPRLALVRHSDRLFSYSQLLFHTPIDDVVASLRAGASTPQEWWDDLLARSPEAAQRAVEMCRQVDFAVLDLWEMSAAGSA